MMNLQLNIPPQKSTWQFGKIGVWVNFIIQKLRLSLSQFSLVGGFFERTRENILQIFRALVYLKMIPPKNGHNTGLWNSKIIKPDTGKVRNDISVSCMYSVFEVRLFLFDEFFGKMHKPEIDLHAESVITNIFFLWKHTPYLSAFDFWHSLV